MCVCDVVCTIFKHTHTLPAKIFMRARKVELRVVFRQCQIIWRKKKNITLYAHTHVSAVLAGIMFYAVPWGI